MSSEQHNTALLDALEAAGIETDEAREKFARSVGIAPRTLRRWIRREVVRPNRALAKLVARRLGVKVDDIWPNGGAAQ